MRQFRSIRWRLLGWYGSLLSVIVVGLAITAFHFVSSRQQQIIGERLQREIGTVSHALRPPKPGALLSDKPGAPILHEENLDTSFDQPGDSYYVVWLKNGRAETKSPNAPADIPRPQEGDTGQRIRGDLCEAYISGQPGDCILVGRSIAAEQAAMNRFGWLLAAGAGGFLFLGLLGGWWIITRALRPIAAITSTAQRISEGDLSHRINVTETESELGELAAVLNATFSRLDAAFARQASFTADAAHELRTPVSVLLTHTQNSLADDDLPEEHREALEACQRAAQRMRGLVEMLLQLARLESRKEPVSPQPCDLASVVSDSAALLQPLIEAHGVTLHLDLKPAETLGNVDSLSQVITNLLTNAIHHGAPSGGEIRISTASDDSGVTCIVADNGPGIGPEHLEHIFERFYRADKARTSNTGRTGLGLAISKAIVHACGGTITAQSEPGRGAIFTVRLPRRP